MKRVSGAAPAIRSATQEAKRALRRLWNAPRFALLAVLTIAAATAPMLAFDLVRRAVLPPLAFERADELVRVWQRLPHTMATSYPKLSYLGQRSRAIELAARTNGFLFLDEAGSSRRLLVQAVTPNYFDVLRVRPLMGRAFGEDENQRPFAHPVVILSEALWRRQFAARPDILGQRISLSGEPHGVVGVMPAFSEDIFRGHVSAVDAWVPAMMSPRGMIVREYRETAATIENPHLRCWVGVGRLRPGRSLREARAEAVLLGREANRLWPEVPAETPFDVVRMSEDAIDGRILRATGVLRAAGVLVLLLGGVNLGSLFFARWVARARTLEVQAMLGAGRLTLLAGPFCEAMVVGLAGAAAGLVLTRGLLALLGVIEPGILAAPFGVTFDPAGWQFGPALVALSLSSALFTALSFGVLPVLRLTRPLARGGYRSGAGGSAGGLRRLRLVRPRGMLVAAQVALALALTVPALLLTRSLVKLVTRDVGFRPEGVVSAPLSLPATHHSDESVPGFVAEATRLLVQVPGVERASFVSCVPIDCPFYDTEVSRAAVAGTRFGASVHVVAPDAFRTLGIALRRGRDFTAADEKGASPVAILSDTAARRLGGAGPGARVSVFGGTVEVVGVVADVPYRDLAYQPMPAIYFPLGQRPQRDGVLVVRSSLALGGSAELVRRSIHSLDPRLERLDVTPLDARIRGDLARFRGAAWLLGAAAALGLFLCGVGIYGLLSSLVVQALPEIGIRIALGATRGTIGLAVAAPAVRLALAGLAAGSGLGIWGGSFLRPYLFGVTPWDAGALLLTAAVAAALAVVTSLLPARRAMRTEPMAVLRSE